MNNKKQTPPEDDRYFESILTRIREIRAGELSARKKIKEVLSLMSDFDASDPQGYLSDAVRALSKLDESGLNRMFNYLCLTTESWAKDHCLMTVETAKNMICQNINEVAFNPNIYTFTCYKGEYYFDEEGYIDCVSFPPEFGDYKGSVILKVIDMDRLLYTFSDYTNRRAYSILAELEERVVANMEDEMFKFREDIKYKDWGDAMFEFSHFEMDTFEPDGRFRTLFVVYRYDTTAS